ncbi:MAG: protein TolQ, partial [Rickettsiales bacterium]
MDQELVTNVAHAPDLSILGLIAGADIIVKAVLLLLLLASIWSWAIIVDKSLLLNKITRQVDNFEKVFWSGQL